MADSFFVPLGEGRWLATVHTTGPWDERAQHGGPPSALVGRAKPRCEPGGAIAVARVPARILATVPGGREVAWARAWRVLRTECPDAGPGLVPPPGRPAAGDPLPPGGWVDGYLSAIEWRGVRGAFGERGPATVWTRMRYPLVPGEEPSPLERVLAVADSG